MTDSAQPTATRRAPRPARATRKRRRRPGEPVVLALANQKGGVAKTTSVASLGAAFVELDKRVLLIDLDAQACLTFSLGIDPESVRTSVNEVVLGRAALADAIIEAAEGVHLVPSVIDLAGASAKRIVLGMGGSNTGSP